MLHLCNIVTIDIIWYIPVNMPLTNIQAQVLLLFYGYYKRNVYVAMNTISERRSLLWWTAY